MLLDLRSLWESIPPGGGFPGRLREGDLAALAPIAGLGDPRTGDLAALTVVAPPGTYAAREGDLAALVPYARAAWAFPRVSDVVMEVVYTTGVPAQGRSLAWTFTLDGHVFYVLDLGQQGTFLYDVTTQAWCQFQTLNSAGWNLRNGTMWNTGVARIVGGDSFSAYVWELDPTTDTDDGFRDIQHAATGGITLRTRNYVSMSELRIASSSGLLENNASTVYLQLSYSDDNGQSYHGPFLLVLTPGTTPDGSQDIRFSSLGSFMAPGRVLQLSDVGGLFRIEGIDAMLDGYDDDGNDGAPDGSG